MPANVIIVHDDPIFITAVAIELRLANHHVLTLGDPLEALPVLETEQPFDVLITRVRFAPGRSNGIALAQMTRVKRPEIKVLFTVAPENIEYTEGLGEFLASPIDIRELAAMVNQLSRLPACRARPSKAETLTIESAKD
jgi:DNA-binding NtrC family response regulator